MPQTHIDIAAYRPVSEYVPSLGDTIIWTGWWTTWYGFVTKPGDLDVEAIFESTPRLLVTLTEFEMKKATKTLSLERIRSRKTCCYILQGGVWYV